jgi:hypothetical protein
MLDSIVYQPPALCRPGEITITPWSYQSLGAALMGMGIVAAASNNFVTANLAVFVPFGVPEPVTITKMFWGNGAAVAGNLDAGIYATNGTRLVSTGSTAQASVSVTQTVDITDTMLARGVYYLALCSDTSGATQKLTANLPAAGIGQSLGLLQQATAFPLASNANPATFAKYVSAFIPMFGAQGYRTIGP